MPMQTHHVKVQRTARYHTLGPPVQEAASLWVVLHGYGYLAADFLNEVACLDDGTCHIVAPEGLSRFYWRMGQPKVGATWMTREDRLAEIEDYVHYLDLLHATLTQGLESPVPLHVLAFSQGSATACRWLTMGQVRADKLYLWGGEVPPDLDLEVHATTLRAAELTMVVGLRDEFISEERRNRERDRLQPWGLPVAFHTYDGRHRIDPDTLLRIVSP